ncbi:hypothetical protein ACIOGT_27850 [Streptomyces microflavus]|uniref:hypothetical protein n=1 Tax=Streptomyces microflavus TaxID=1919 RepID=UPI0038141C4E
MVGERQAGGLARADEARRSLVAVQIGYSAPQPYIVFLSPVDSDDPIQVLLERQLDWAQPRIGAHQGSVCARSKVHAPDPGIPRIACPGQSSFGETTRGVEHSAVTADVEQFANELVNGPDELY